MYFDLTDEQQAIKATAKDFLASRFKSDRIREIAASGDGTDPDGWGQMAELGWTGLAFGAIAQIQNSLGRLARLATEVRVNGGSAADDAYYRQRIAQLHIEAETMRLNAYRGLTKTMQSGIPGPEGSLGKWQWADINQGLTELALEIEGAYAPLGRGSEHAVAGGAWQYGFLRSRANSIEGGTTDILKNIIAERVLGLPRLR